MNSTEWEITLYMHDFDESWMRYGLGRGSDIKILKSRFQISHTDFFRESPNDILRFIIACET